MTRFHPPRLAAALLACGLALSCKRETQPVDIDLLRALGYVEEAPANTRDDPARVGVVIYDPKRSQPGYNLYTEQHAPIAILMDARGRSIHRFEDPGAAYWARVALLADGDLLVVGADVPGRYRPDGEPTGRHVLRVGWDGSIRWKRYLEAHHDLELLPDGRVLTLEMHQRLVPEIDPAIPVRDDRIVTLNSEGETIATHSLHDLLAGGPLPFAFQDVRPRLAQLAKLGKDHTEPAASSVEQDYIDLLHTNSLELFDQPSLLGRSPIYQPDSLLVTLRHQDRIAVVGIESGGLRWVWGEGELEGPHDATWIENGNILVFDNGLARGWSRVLEVDPATASIVQEYGARKRERFYSASRGSAQRLANGNTLVTNSESGQAFEVSPAGVIVWEFWNPTFTNTGRRRLIGTMTRIDSDTVDAILERYGAGPTSDPVPRGAVSPGAS